MKSYFPANRSEVLSEPESEMQKNPVFPLLEGENLQKIALPAHISAVFQAEPVPVQGTNDMATGIQLPEGHAGPGMRTLAGTGPKHPLHTGHTNGTARHFHLGESIFPARKQFSCTFGYLMKHTLFILAQAFFESASPDTTPPYTGNAAGTVRAPSPAGFGATPPGSVFQSPTQIHNDPRSPPSSVPAGP